MSVVVPWCSSRTYADIDAYYHLNCVFPQSFAQKVPQPSFYLKPKSKSCTAWSRDSDSITLQLILYLFGLQIAYALSRFVEYALQSIDSLPLVIIYFCQTIDLACFTAERLHSYRITPIHLLHLSFSGEIKVRTTQIKQLRAENFAQNVAKVHLPAIAAVSF